MAPWMARAAPRSAPNPDIHPRQVVSLRANINVESNQIMQFTRRTLLGVAVLGYPDQLVEVEAVAALR